MCQARVRRLTVTAGEQVGRVVVELEQDLDGAVDDVEHDPLGVVAGQLAVFEDPSPQQVTDPPVLTSRGGRAVAAQLADYWREGVIPTVRYSPSAVTSPPAVTGELGFTTAAMTGCTQGDRVESQVPVRDDPDC